MKMQTEQLINNLVIQMGVVPPAPNPIRIFLKWTGLSAAYIILSLLFLGIRPDFATKLHSFLFFAELSAIAGIIASSLLSASLLAFPDVYQQKKLALLPFVAFLLFCLIMAVEFIADNPPSPPPNHAMECLLCIIALSLIPGAFILYNIRKYASTHYYAAGSVAVLAAFSIGGLILRISEETDSIMHLLEWHYLPMIGAGIIGLAIGKVCLKW